MKRKVHMRALRHDESVDRPQQASVYDTDRLGLYPYAVSRDDIDTVVPSVQGSKSGLERL